MRRGYSVKQAMTVKVHQLELSERFERAFGSPETTGVWFVWGESGNGKTSFVMQLCKELTRFGKVVYDSLEQGLGASMQQTLRQQEMVEVNRRFMILDRESLAELDHRMKLPRSPKIYVIDSIQCIEASIGEIRKFLRRHRDRLIIFVSQTEGSHPSGRTAQRVMFDADMKIYVEGFRAMSKGRFFGTEPYYTVWGEGAERYYGSKKEKK